MLGVSLVWPKAMGFDPMIAGSNPAPSARKFLTKLKTVI